ncbi:MAG TPA: HAD family phosphatase [Solirubrobacterales bacterium]|nr:HAD family phosphatase [Solirubrobacterales bacterium]
MPERERADGGHEALLVDFGGVLTTNMWEGFDAFCRAEGIEPGSVMSLFKHEPEALADLRLLETGELEPEKFERRFAPRLGIERAEGLIARMFAAVGPEERLIAAVRAASESGVRTGLISNSWGTAIYDPDALDGLFDVAIISGEVGLHKPQAEIYLLAAERLGVEPRTCVFVDDLRENVHGAEEVGMTAILHRAPEATVARLEELLGITVPASRRPRSGPPP